MNETEPPVLTDEQFNNFLESWYSDRLLQVHMLRAFESGEPLMKLFFESADIFTTFPPPVGPDTPSDGEGNISAEAQAEIDRLFEEIQRRRAAGEDL